MNTIPLASKLRPTELTEFFGQSHILAPGKPLYEAILSGKLHSMILWGPPGTGKTTLAKLMSQASNSQFLSLSAVTTGIKEVREAIQKAKTLAENENRSTILFIDEVHRFNKIQQDVFLPYIEDGTITFIGATTENPSFEIINALLSRVRVYTLKTLEIPDILKIIDRALTDRTKGYGKKKIQFDEPLRIKLAEAADGDARQALNFLELAVDNASTQKDTLNIDEELLIKVISGTLQRFDKKGDYFYDQISALHKAVRGSSPDGALYWFARMLIGGADPLYIARRVVKMASEDIGNADPRGLEIALNAWDAQQRLGSPEGELAIAHALVYLAVAPKSNAVYTAFNQALEEAEKYGTLPVPFHIRNAPTKLMKNLGYGKEYRYDHNEPDAHAKGQTYFPEKMGERVYYRPTSRGLEAKIAERLAKLRGED